MKLVSLSAKNYRSIKNLEEFRIEPLQVLVGENNTGKSNILRCLKCFLSAGAGGVQPEDFNDKESYITIRAEFGRLTGGERRKLRPYLLGDRFILEKNLSVTPSGKIDTKFRGYKAEPKDWWLSVEKVIEKQGRRPRWKDIAEEKGIIDYVRSDDGRINKRSYQKGLERYLEEHEEMEYDEPRLGDTHALGIQQNLLSVLPKFFLLPAITDYSDEISKKSSSTAFHRLMADLVDRIITADPRYSEIQEAIKNLHQLLNPPDEGGKDMRPETLSQVETTLHSTIKELMPTVEGVQLAVQVAQTKDLFSKGVEIKVDDGVLTDVLVKGHGMQRSIVFSLLQMLINQSGGIADSSPVILAIEEPELYIHPHAQRLVYKVLRGFAGVSDDEEADTKASQVIYSTHSSRLVDVSRYQQIAVVRKNSQTGTVITQSDQGILGDPGERKAFKVLTSFGLEHNEIFFSRYCILVEGAEDKIAVIATARKLGRIDDLPDEIGLSIITSEGKQNITKFQKVLNAFRLPYGVLLELDGKTREEGESKRILENLNGNRVACIPQKLEVLLEIGQHFKDQYHAKQFFSDSSNINSEMENLVCKLLPDSL